VLEKQRGADRVVFENQVSAITTNLAKNLRDAASALRAHAQNAPSPARQKLQARANKLDAIANNVAGRLKIVIATRSGVNNAEADIRAVIRLLEETAKTLDNIQIEAVLVEIDENGAIVGGQRNLL